MSGSTGCESWFLTCKNPCDRVLVGFCRVRARCRSCLPVGLFGCHPREGSSSRELAPGPQGCPQTSSGAPRNLAKGEALWHFKREEGGREMMLVWEQAWSWHLPTARLQGGMALPRLLRTAKCVLRTFEFPRCWESLSSPMAAVAFFSFSSSPAVSKA